MAVDVTGAESPVDCARVEADAVAASAPVFGDVVEADGWLNGSSSSSISKLICRPCQGKTGRQAGENGMNVMLNESSAALNGWY